MNQYSEYVFYTNCQMIKLYCASFSVVRGAKYVILGISLSKSSVPDFQTCTNSQHKHIYQYN